MSENSKFRDGWVLPKDFDKQFEQQKLKLQHNAGLLDQTDEFQFEKFIVDKTECKGEFYSPTCLYDFTQKILLADIIVYRPKSLTSFIVSDYFFSEKQQVMKS